MDLVAPNQPFCFNYEDFGQDESLFVRAAVYDVTSGVAVFVQYVVMASIGVGLYSGNLTAGAAGTTYLVISVIFTDGTYATPDPNRAPNSRVFQAIDNDVTFQGFAFPAFNQLETLPLAFTIYDLSSGSAVLVQGPDAMAHVAYGVYFGSFTGDLNHTYQALQVVYTDGTYTTPDTFYAPGADALMCFTACSGGDSIDPGVSNVLFGIAYRINGVDLVGTFDDFASNTFCNTALEGMSLNAELAASSLTGILEALELSADLTIVDEEEILTGESLEADLGGQL
jgi:hypothetical protein